MEGDLRASYYQDRARSRMSPAPLTKQFADCAQSRSVSPVLLGRGGRKTTLNLRIGGRDFEDLPDDRDEDLISTNASDRRHWQLPSTREELILRYSSQSFKALRTMPVRSYKLDGAELLFSRLSKHYAKFLRQWLKNAQECGVSTARDGKRHLAHSSTQIIPRQRPMSRGDFDDDSMFSGDRHSPLHTEPTVDLYRPLPRRPPDRPSSVSRLHSIALRRQRRPVERLINAIAAPVNRRKRDALDTVGIAYRKHIGACAILEAVAGAVEGRVRDFFTHELFSIPAEHYQWFKCMGKVVRRLVFILSRVETETAFLLVTRQLRTLAERRALKLVQTVGERRLKEEKRKFWEGFLLFRDTKTMEMRLAAMRRTLNRAFSTLATRRKELQQAAFIALWRSLRLAVRPRPKACAHVLWRVMASQFLYRKNKAFRQWKLTANTYAGKDLLMCGRVLFTKFFDFRKKMHFLAWKALRSPLSCRRLSLLAQCLSSVVLSAKLKVWSQLTTTPRLLSSPAVLRLTVSVLRRLYNARLEYAYHRLQRTKK